MESDATFLDILFCVDGVDLLTPPTIRKLAMLATSTFSGMPVVIYYIKNARWKFLEVMKAFNDSGVDWNVHDDDGNTCFHSVMPHYGQNSQLPESVVTMMLESGADPTFKNNFNQSPIEVAIAECVSDSLIKAMVKAAPNNFLNEMNILNQVIRAWPFAISNKGPGFPLTLNYLTDNHQIVVTCDHLIAFFELPPTRNFYSITVKIIKRLILHEVKRRRPQLLCDLAKMISVIGMEYEMPITKFSEKCKIDVDIWSDEHGSVLYHLIAGPGNWTKSNLDYICKLLSTADPNQTYKGRPLIFGYLKSSPVLDLKILNKFAELSTDWNVLDELGRCPLHYIIRSNVKGGLYGNLIGAFASAGARLDYAGDEGNNILHVAMSTNIDLVQGLVVGRANAKELINARNHGGKSCLGLVMSQLRSDSLVMIRFLVNCGADVNEIDNEDNNLLHIALANWDDCKGVDMIKKVIDALTKLGMDIEVASNQVNAYKGVPFYSAIKSRVFNLDLIPNEEILNNNKHWGGDPIIDFVLDSTSEAMKRSKCFALVSLVQELLIRGANRSSPSTLARLIAVDGSTTELIELAVNLLDQRTSIEDLYLTLDLIRPDFVPIILENGNQEMISNIKLQVPNAVNKIVNITMKSPFKADLKTTIKLLVEKFAVDINCSTEEDGFVIHNLISLDESGKQEVLDCVLSFDSLEVDKKQKGKSGLDFAILNHNYAAAAKLIEHFADFSHWQSVLISKRGFTRFAKLLHLIDRPSLQIKFDSSISGALEVQVFQNWIELQKRSIRSLSELCALLIRRQTRTKQELKNLIKDFEFPEQTNDVLFLRKEF